MCWLIGCYLGLFPYYLPLGVKKTRESWWGERTVCHVSMVPMLLLSVFLLPAAIKALTWLMLIAWRTARGLTLTARWVTEMMLMSSVNYFIWGPCLRHGGAWSCTKPAPVIKHPGDIIVNISAREELLHVDLKGWRIVSLVTLEENYCTWELTNQDSFMCFFVTAFTV